MQRMQHSSLPVDSNPDLPWRFGTLDTTSLEVSQNEVVGIAAFSPSFPGNPGENGTSLATIVVVVVVLVIVVVVMWCCKLPRVES